MRGGVFVVDHGFLTLLKAGNEHFVKFNTNYESQIFIFKANKNELFQEDCSLPNSD